MNCSAVILAGGASRRMGRDKALMPWKGSTLIESVAREVLNAAGNVTLIGSPERIGKVGFPVICDQIEGCGPLGGLQVLDLSRASLGPEGISILASWLQKKQRQQGEDMPAPPPRRPRRD